MKIGWLHDDPGYPGGAELTMAEFRSAAPVGVDVVDVAPGHHPRADRFVVGNCQTYPSVYAPVGTTIRYHHDVSLAPMDSQLFGARHIFCSPLQRQRMQMEGDCIPPALDLDRFRHYANSNHRSGAVCVGRMAYGKGLEFLAEYPEPVDVYSSVPIQSEGSIRYRGPAQDVAKVLARYERFVFLPTAIEPFGRAAVEAWAAGCRLVLNKNVGARYYLEEAPEKLETAAENFWAAVLA